MKKPGATDMDMATGITIEVCIDSVESAIAAHKGGADRLELCGNLSLGGGTTPSLGLFRQVREAVPTIPIMIMIRPRTGDFLYTAWELSIMQQDVRIFKAAGADGVVFGILEKDGRIDVKRNVLPGATHQRHSLAKEAEPMQICFHRAFDMCSEDVLGAQLDISDIPQVTRILTSGQAPTAPAAEALPRLRTLIQTSSLMPASARILVGSGVNGRTIGPLLAELLPCGLRELHLSGGGWMPSNMEFQRESMGMGVGGDGEWGIWRTSEEHVRDVRAQVDEAWKAFVDKTEDVI